MSLRIKELNRDLATAREVHERYETEREAFHDQAAVMDRHWTQVRLAKCLLKGNADKERV